MKPQYCCIYPFLTVLMCVLFCAGSCHGAEMTDGSSGVESIRQVEQDSDGDGIIDRIAVKDAYGDLVRLSADTDGDGNFDTFQYYEGENVVRLETDTNADGRVDERDIFENGRRVRHEGLALNGDIESVQIFDENDLLVEWRQDTTGEGRLNAVCRYDAGGLAAMAMDTTGDGAYDTIQTYRNGILKQQRRDTDGDGLMDMTTEFVKGKPSAVLEDTDGDERADIWRQYENGFLISTEEDRDHDGTVDARHTYGEDGRIVCSRLDNDGDGCFELRVRFGVEKWSRVVELSDADERLLQSQAYSGEVLRQHKLMDVATGLPVLVETYDEHGRIQMSREAGKTPGRLDLAWYYDEQGEVSRAESDRDADGKVDIWYHYQDGVAVRIEEDRDRDGKPDLWEDYAEGKTLLSRSEDLDFDGTADIEEKF